MKAQDKPQIHGLIKSVINDDPTQFAMDFKETVKEKIDQKIMDRKADIQAGMNESKSEDDVKGLISSCKKMIGEYKKSGNDEGVKFLEGIVSSYEKNDGLSPAQFKAAAKWCNPGK